MSSGCRATILDVMHGSPSKDTMMLVSRRPAPPVAGGFSEIMYNLARGKDVALMVHVSQELKGCTVTGDDVEE